MEILNHRRNSVSPTSFLQPHGVDRFHAEKTYKKAEFENKVLQNRISKLLKAEENARKLSEYSKIRSEELSKQHELYLLSIREKYNNKVKMQEEEELRRMQINQAKEKRRLKMLMVNQNMLDNRRGLAANVKKEKESNEAMYRKYLVMVQAQNYDKASYHKNFKEQLVNERSKSQLNYQNNLKDEYIRAIEQHKQDYIKALQVRSQLAKVEEELVHRFSNSKDEYLQKFSSLASSSHGKSLSTATS
jgi:hypothetical protein